MKKLIAMIGAVAMSFGLFATEAPDPLATSFEAEDAGVSQDGTTWTPESPWAWASEATAAAITLKPIGSEVLPYAESGVMARRSDEFAGLATNDKYLPLETGKDTLQFDVTEGNIYLDQLVKFTGFEEMQTNFVAGTKIALWMSAIEQEGTDPEAAGYVAGKTNLYVTCAKQTESAIETVAVKLAGTYEPEKWYRVTIKSLGNIYKDDAPTSRGGFVVYVNGNQVSSTEATELINDDTLLTPFAKEMLTAGKLFPAIADTTIDMAKVGYAGIGAIDDIISDINGPEFAKTIDFSVTATGAAVLKVLKAGTEEEIEAYNGKYTIAAGQKVDIVFTANGPYVLKTDPLTLTNQEPHNGENDFSTEVDADPAVAQIDGDTPVYFASMEAAFAAVQPNETITVLEDSAFYEVEEGAGFMFPINAQIIIGDNGIDWTVMLALPTDYLMDTYGVAAGQSLVVIGNLVLTAGVPAQGSIYVTGETQLAADIALNGEFTTGTLANAIEEEEAIVGYNKMTLGADGAYQQADQIAEANLGNFFGNDDLTKIEETEVKEDEEVVAYKYTLKGATGFAIIIADKTTYYPTLQDAINAALTGQTVTIMDTATFDHYVEVAGKEITLDLNGQTLSYTGATDGHCAICIHNGAGLTVDDSTVAKAGVLDGGLCAGAIQLTVNGDDSTNPAKLTVNAGKLVGKYYAVSGNGNRPNTEVVINGGWLLGTATDDSAGIYNPQAGTLTINGGKIEGACGVYIKAGVVQCAVNSGAEIIAVGSKLPHQDESSLKPTGDAIVVDNANYPGGTPNVEIKGGTFVSANGAAVASYAWAGKEPIVGFVTGGTFTGNVKIDDALAGGNWAFGPFVAGQPQSPVPAVAKIGTVNYASLAAAVAAATADQTVTLIANTTLDATLTVAKALAFNLNGKTVTFANTLTKGIDAAEAGELVISNGTITVADGRANIAYSRAIYLLHTSGVFKDLVINVPGFEYALNKDCDTEPDSDCWKKPLDYTLDCENVAINGNGSLFHIENAEATLKDCVTTVNTALPSFGGAHEAAIYSSCGAVTTVDGGIFTAPNALQTGNYGGDIIVKGGEFNGNIKSWMLDADTRDFANVNKANIQIEGGKFTGNFVYADNCSEESQLLTVVISGGDFSDKTIPTAFIEQKEHKVAKWVASTIPDYVTPGYDDETFDITFTDAAEWTNVVKTVYNVMPEAPAAPTKEGYTFTGWDKEIVPATEATTYTAQYTANTYGINYTWVDNDGAAVTALDNTLPENFTFGGDAIELKAEMVTLTEAYTAVAFAPATVTTDAAEAFAVTVTLTKKAEEPKVDPEQPTKPYDTDDQAKKAAEAMNDGDHVKTSSINVPAEAGTTDAEKDAYAALFVAVAKADKTVVVELNADGTNTLAASAEKVVEKATGLGDSTATEVTITPSAEDIVPGFYYGLGASTEVAGEKIVTSWQQATTEGLTEPLTANKPENSTKGFFQVRVSVRQQN